MTKAFYVTTAIDYANSTPHVGTAFEKVGADVLARYHRWKGRPTYFLMGNDEHSLNVERRAREQGLDPKVYCDRMEEQFQAVWKKLDLSHDVFIRTTWPRHRAAVHELFRRMRAGGDIYRGTWKGHYCVSCEAYVKPADLVDGKCPNHKAPPEWVEEENLFFALSRYRDRILAHIREHPDFIEPETRRNEILRLLEEGLEDISISRAQTRWGIPVPDEPGQTVYVWFDALINYVTGAGFPDEPERFAATWPADVHVIGKDITRFHVVIWPAMLLSAGLPLPRKVFAHGFVSIRGQKMSKTLGTTIDPQALAERFGPDPLRYFLLREIAFDSDGDFSGEKLADRYNADLANDLGNLVQRTLTMANRYLGGVLERAEAQLPATASLREKVLGCAPRIDAAVERFQFHVALAELWEAIRRANTYLEQTSPWALSKEGRTRDVAESLGSTVEAIRIVAALLTPFLPRTACAIRRQLGLPADAPAKAQEAQAWGLLPAGHRVGAPEVLFPRLQKVAE